MADKKFEQYTEETAPTNDDLVLIKEKAAGATKRVQLGNLLPTGNVTTTKLGDDAVTDAKLVNGKILRRQGGSATDWSVVGSTNYDVSASNTIIQAGTIFCNSSPKGIVFPVTFNNAPLVFVTVTSVNSTSCFAVALGASVTGFNCQVYDNAGSTNNGQNVNWWAVGQ